MRTSKHRFEIRKRRVRNKISNISSRNRLSVFRSNQHIYAQIIDDNTSNTLVEASTLDKTIRKDKSSNCNIATAIEVGKLLGKRATQKGISKVVFDKSGFKYHGRVKALAEAAREEIEF